MTMVDEPYTGPEGPDEESAWAAQRQWEQDNKHMTREARERAIDGLMELMKQKEAAGAAKNKPAQQG
jgi:hypothetical protein